jgi:hypothetical protein
VHTLETVNDSILRFEEEGLQAGEAIMGFAAVENRPECGEGAGLAYGLGLDENPVFGGFSTVKESGEKHVCSFTSRH